MTESIKHIQAIVTDIEGTTSSISFVKDILFPYARENLASYVAAHPLQVESVLSDIRLKLNDAALTTDKIIEILMGWIDEDRKETSLKSLQGMIWENGYKQGYFKGHVYDDAAEMLQHWFDQGLKIFIYSSGSVAAQKLLYGYSDHGDLTPLFSGYFDTTTGPKHEASSYSVISQAIKIMPSHILFLSDQVREIQAAHQAGFQTILVDRDSPSDDLSSGFLKVKNFHDIHLENNFS
jgi:enolase-phosphatase E1